MIHDFQDTVQIRVAGDSVVQIPATQIVADLLKRLQPNASSGSALTPPAIGQAWPGQGGVYAGIVRGGDSERDYHLIVGPDLGERTAWQKMRDAAAACQVGDHKDFSLPLRREQSVMFGNVPELFDQVYYWSDETYAGNPDYAWIQNFDFGDQHYYSKDDDCRARAVRRLAI